MVRMTKVEAQEIMDKLAEAFPDAKGELDHSNPFELLIATILSAQTTDKAVNKVTPALFAKYPTPEYLAEAPLEDVENIIRNIGLYRNKAKNIKGTGGLLVEKYAGEVPTTRDELVTLPGVGRKTANVVLSNAFDVPAIAVDTHVFRVSNRLGLSKSKDVEKCEKDLNRILDKEIWSHAHHLLIFQGRYVCKAQRPLCEECNVVSHCRFIDSANKAEARKVKKATPSKQELNKEEAN